MTISAIAIVLLVACVLWRVFYLPGPRLPKGLPIIGAKKGDWLPYWQATWRNAFDIQKAATDAYVNHKDQTVILPVAGLGGATFVLLPASENKFVTEQPDTVLSLRHVIIEGLKYRYTLPDEFLYIRPLHQKLITSTLTNQIGNVLPALADETIQGFAQHWGTDPETWRNVCVWDTMGPLIGKATNRVFVGLPECRNPVMLGCLVSYARSLPVTATLLSWLWAPLRPLAAPVLTFPTRFYMRRFENILRPEIERRSRLRLEAEAKAESDQDTVNIKTKPNDFLQWSIEQALESGEPCMWQPGTLASRILLMNMVSIHTSSLTITNVIFDLMSSKPEYLDELRTEIATVLTEHGGMWTKAALAKMEKLDSVFRESARLNTLVAIGLRRVVVAKEGLTTPSGVHIPCGNFCTVPNLPILTDPSRYPDPDVFKPWRFVELRRSIDSGDHIDDHVHSARMTFAATSGEYLAFGNGRQACPGRFFAAAELKLMLAYMLMLYDIETLDTRPRGRWIGILRLPPTKATIRVRRRKASQIPPVFLTHLSPST